MVARRGASERGLEEIGERIAIHLAGGGGLERSEERAGGRHPRIVIGESSTPIADFLLARLAAEYGLEELAPLGWAEEWDNVGLLIDPPGRRTVRRVLITIDLTTAVLAEVEGVISAYSSPYCSASMTQMRLPGIIIL